eukprot:CAMPEP_0194492406 /NCGR_PEP_ID=MMETSP0253-20130528/10976_1 /TAXON_ID=2966 /ORGANISM="Noctiluca scintillans" /LENGTH=107 /DNA_ID=CAMNT_0039333273 /DNA_START=875 /DNA_END=1198 /DNA_ORIENTATION=+
MKNTSAMPCARGARASPSDRLPGLQIMGDSVENATFLFTSSHFTKASGEVSGETLAASWATGETSGPVASSSTSFVTDSPKSKALTAGENEGLITSTLETFTPASNV